MTTQYSELQLDALRELANIGSGNAGTALSSMLGRPIDVSVPAAAVLSLADAVDAAGPPEANVTAVLIPVIGGMDAFVLLLFGTADRETLCGMLGVEPDSELGISALGEIGNILGTSYLNSLAAMTGLELEPRPPQTANNMLGAVVESVLSVGAATSDVVLMLDSDLIVEGEACSLSFLLLPSASGVDELLQHLGLGG